MWSKTSTMEENLIFHHFINFFIHIWYFIYISSRCATSWLTLPKESQPASRLRISMRYTPTSLKGKSFWGEVHYYLCKGEFLFRIIKQLKHGFCQAVLALLFTTRQSDADPEQKEAVLSYMEKAASRQGGTVNPANIRWNIVMLVVAHFQANFVFGHTPNFVLPSWWLRHLKDNIFVLIPLHSGPRVGVGDVHRNRHSLHDVWPFFKHW